MICCINIKKSLFLKIHLHVIPEDTNPLFQELAKLVKEQNLLLAFVIRVTGTLIIKKFLFPTSLSFIFISSTLLPPLERHILSSCTQAQLTSTFPPLFSPTTPTANRVYQPNKTPSLPSLSLSTAHDVKNFIQMVRNAWPPASTTRHPIKMDSRAENPARLAEWGFVSTAFRSLFLLIRAFHPGKRRYTL